MTLTGAERSIAAMRPALLALVLAASSCGSEPDASGPSREDAGASAAAASSSAPSASAATSASADVITQASAPYSAAPAVADGQSPVSDLRSEIDGAALRARQRARLKADETPVIAVTGEDPAALGEAICEAVVPKRPAATPVLIKPNIGGFDAIKRPGASGGDNGVDGRITSPEFVRGVIRCLKKRGHTRITIADGWGGAHDYWEKLIDVSGYAALAASEGVPLACMCDDGTFDKIEGTPGLPLKVTGMEGTRLPTLLMPKLLADHLNGGLFISVPKLKAHRFAVVSLGIKGMQGTVMLSSGSPAHRQKFRMHQELADYLQKKQAGEEDRALYVEALEKFAQRMSDVLEIEAPDAVLLDGAPAMQGDGFQELVPIREKIAIGGTNPVRVDQVGARFLGAWDNEKLALGLRGHRTSPLIEVAAKRFGIDLATTRVEGAGKDVALAPRPFVFKSMAPFSLGARPATP